MKTIELTDEQYEKLVDILEDHSDCGPRDYGWDSQELIDLRAAVEGGFLTEAAELMNKKPTPVDGRKVAKDGVIYETKN